MHPEHFDNAERQTERPNNSNAAQSVDRIELLSQRPQTAANNDNTGLHDLEITGMEVPDTNENTTSQDIDSPADSRRDQRRNQDQPSPVDTDSINEPRPNTTQRGDNKLGDQSSPTQTSPEQSDRGAAGGHQSEQQTSVGTGPIENKSAGQTQGPLEDRVESGNSPAPAAENSATSPSGPASGAETGAAIGSEVPAPRGR